MKASCRNGVPAVGRRKAHTERQACPPRKSKIPSGTGTWGAVSEKCLLMPQKNRNAVRGTEQEQGEENSGRNSSPQEGSERAGHTLERQVMLRQEWRCGKMFFTTGHDVGMIGPEKAGRKPLSGGAGRTEGSDNIL